MSKVLKLSKLRIDGGTQPRSQIDQASVDDYADCYRKDETLPPPVVFHDGVTYWLADGYHRYHGAMQAGLKELSCDVHNGTQRDAILFSCGANATHGLKRTNADKRKAVATLLADTEWEKKSDRWIADICVVSVTLVGDVRRESGVALDTCDEPKKRVGKDGKEYKVPEPQPVKATGKPSGGNTFNPKEWEEPEAEAEPEAEPATEESDAMAVWNREVEAYARKINAVFHEHPTGPYMHETRLDIIKSQLASAANSVRVTKGHGTCTYCGGKGCKKCLQTGWLTKTDYESSGGK